MMETAIERVFEHLRTKAAEGNAYARALMPTLNGPRRKVAQRTWLSRHDVVDTLQITPRPDGRMGGWAPGMREVATYPTYALFDGSRRDYAGVVCITATDDVWCGFDKSMNTVIIYAAA